jgi:hypothetical protein
MQASCFGLHDPFVCRVVPAALLFMTELKNKSGQRMPPGMVDALLTQTLKYGTAFEQVGMFDDYCEFVAHNHTEFFESVYQDEIPNFSAFIDYIRFMLPFDQFMAVIQQQRW